MKKYLKLLMLILLGFSFLVSKGQVSDTLEIYRNENGVINFARFKPNTNRNIQNDTAFLKAILHARIEDTFKTISEVRNEAGGIHKKFQQYYKGIKVENAEYIIHARKGIIETINGDFAQINLPSVSPSINDQQALKKALDFVHSKIYKWEDENCEKNIKESTNNPNATYFPYGELVIIKDFNIGGKECKLAWKFTISSLVPYNEQRIYIDANTGEILANTPLILDANTPGVAETRYSQNRNIKCDSYLDNGTTKYRLNETRNTTPSHNINIHTWNLQSQSNPNNKIEFNNTNTNFITGSWPPITADQAALDAHWGAELVSDYWSSVRHRNSLNNQGLSFTNYVHYWENSNGFPNNAGWDGNNHLVVYGDGDGYNSHPFTALDIVAHEMGHGINQFTANLGSLTYDQECDALNEGFSDIWGATIKHWAVPNKQTWLHGDEVNANPYYNCERDLTNPNSTLASEGRHPDTWHGDFWSATGEAHFNSTVLSHWFYLLSIGGAGWNNNHTSHAQPNDGYCWSVSGIGMNDASRIVYIAESHYLTSSANYNSVRLATIQAALDSFGLASNQVVSVTNSWNAVGVGAAYQYQISGPRLLCTSESYYIDKLPAGSTITWGTPTSNIALASNIHANPGTFSKVSIGNGFIYATVDCGNIQINLPVHTGPYSSSDYPILGPSSAPCRTIQNYWIQPLEGTTSINWTWPQNWTYMSGQNTTSLTLRTGTSSGMVGVGVNNTCGQSGSYYMKYTTITGYCGYSLSVSPNPASEFIDVSIIEPLDNNSDTSSTYSSIPIASQISNEKSLVTYNIIISDNLGAIYYKDKKFSRNFRLFLPNLKSGNYIIAVDDGVKKYNSTLIIMK